MTKEEAVKEIEKAFGPAFANYIITALTEGATVSDKEPMVEIDLYSVIKQKYIEREVLDKISAEVKALSPEPTAYDVVDGSPVKDAVWETIADALQIIDKYKSESEDRK